MAMKGERVAEDQERNHWRTRLPLVKHERNVATPTTFRKESSTFWERSSRGMQVRDKR